MGQRLAGKTAIITGGASGCGAAAVRLFLAEGAKVGFIDRNAELGAALAAELNIPFAQADVADAAQVSAAVAKLQAANGPANVLFNHAGTIIIKPFLDCTETDWDWLMAVNVKSMFLVTKEVLPGMLAQGGGAIVCTASISASAATPMEVIYNTSKAACLMFARSIAVEFRDQNIRCNAVSPGFIATPHGLNEVKQLQALGIDASPEGIAIQQGRMCKPEEVAQAALFLASDDASFVNGTELLVDNGFTAV
ncbi:MAG TPA: SDR family oxidoreductase [Acidocella sp.]|nr:MAG: oxidoreductase [Acidocella sp. 20-58-15]HQT39141.1 SDR family oxidoreductase [Acidocella sp.]